MRTGLLILATLLGGAFAAQAGEQDFFHPASVTPQGVHSCLGFYPEAAREANLGGAISLAFRIGVNGTVSDVAVKTSSGNADLDDAAKSCVRTWRYAPVLKDGKPVAAAWNADVEFKAVGDAAASAAPPRPVQVEQGKVCVLYPWYAHRHQAEGNAAVKFAVNPDGGVGDIAMNKSSGDADLDEAALDCVKSLKYRPHSGGDVPRPVTARVTWSYMKHGPSLVRWRFIGTSAAAFEGLKQVSNGAAACLKAAGAHTEFAGGLGGMTTLRVRYRHGEIQEVSVLASSGNDALDRYAAECYRAEAPDPEAAEELRQVSGSTIRVVWQRYVHH